jgi:signal transduction histidine kinase
MLLLAGSGPVRAQVHPSPSLHRLPSQYIHASWTSDDGLPQDGGHVIEQTRDGYLWIATQNGLARFDGVRFEVFTTADGLPSNDVGALLEASDGSMWIGTTAGLAHRSGGETRIYTTANGLSHDYVRSLHEDESGVLWIGTIEGGLHRFDGKQFTHFGTDNGLAGNVVLDIAPDGRGGIWVATEGGLSHLQNGRLASYGTEAGLPHPLVWDVHPRADGSVWLGTSGGLVHLDDGSAAVWTEEDGLCGTVVDVIEEGAHGELWIGTLGGGLCRLHQGEFTSFESVLGASNDRIRDIEVDREGTVWIGSERGGIHSLRDGKFYHFSRDEGLLHNVVFPVLEDSRGTMWIGTEGGGLSRLDGDRLTNVTQEIGLPSGQVYALHEGRDGSLWIGMYDGGLCRLKDDEALTCFPRADGRERENVFVVYEDRTGHVWIGGQDGLYQLRGDVYEAVTPHPILADAAVTSIKEDDDGRIWIATFNAGIVVIDGEDVRRITTADGLSSDVVLTLHRDARGRFWAGTQEGGICRVTGREAACVSSADGLFSDTIVQVLDDHAGHLWLGSLQGIGRIRIDALDAVLDGTTQQLHSESYGKHDGLRTTELNGGTQPNAWRSRDGRLWFATTDGVAVVDPETMRSNHVAPPVVIESFRAQGELVDMEGEIEISPGRRDVTFTYTGLSLQAPERVRFRYQLEGYDEDRVDAAGRREAYYTNLAPGDYTFRVWAANNDGVWNEEGASVSFYLAPFFYQTWWFAAACALAAVALAFLVFRLRIRQMKVRERELEQQIDARTRDLRREKDRTEEAKHVIEGQASELRSLNDDLEEQAEKLRDLNDNLQAKVQEQFQLLVKERERYETDLIEAKDRAEASDRLKSAILNNLSHEFRTPLTAILGFTEIIAMEAPEDLQEFTSEIDRGGKRLLRTLDALLEFSRLEANESRMRSTDVDLTTTAVSVVRDLKKLADQKNVALHFRASAPLSARLDAGAVEEIIWNLVDNAIKFTYEGEVEACVGSDGDRAFIRVRDTGVGIGEAFRERIFEAFAQESDGFDRAFEGVGLGLTITKRLVEHMGGEIDVVSEQGVGSTFTVYFPTAMALVGAA